MIRAKVDVVCRVGEHQHRWHIDVHGNENFHTYWSAKLKHDGIWGWGIYDLNWWGIYDLNGWGIYELNGWDMYSLDGWGSYGKLFFGRYAQKNTCLQGSTLSSHRMTMGFGPFELPTHGLLQKGWDHSPTKFCFVRSPAFWLAQLLLGAFTVVWIFKLLNKLGVG